ncbi:unnamed protein product, partial [Vitis vinifera]
MVFVFLLFAESNLVLEFSTLGLLIGTSLSGVWSDETRIIPNGSFVESTVNGEVMVPNQKANKYISLNQTSKMGNLSHASPKFPCILLTLLISYLFSFATCKTHNFLQRGSSLSVEDDSDYITSPDRSFTCGFYGAGENAYWFSIWFTNSKERTVVWMANRDRPVNGRGSRISLRRDGIMNLRDADGSTVWETNTTSTDVDRAELLDTGNLVLKNPHGKILWQSFDFPTDTLLPNQILTRRTKLISIIRGGDFSSGYYILYFDNDNILRMMYDGPSISSLYWPNPDLGILPNKRRNSNSSRIAVLDEMGRFLSSDNASFRASDMGLGVKRRLTIGYDGNLRLYSLNHSTGLWMISWMAFGERNRVHGLCGRNGICVYTPEPKCSCPPGYEVSDPSDWSKGCKSKFHRSCSRPQQVKFVELPHTDFYGSDVNHLTSVSLETCRKTCLEDCLCEAFAYRLTGNGLCFNKIALFNGFRSPNFPGTIYLKLPVDVETSASTLVNVTSPVEDGYGFGAVYKGILEDERVGRHRLLVYEHVENLSLDKHLFSTTFLGWKERFNVAVGTARGLAYLHHECLEWKIQCEEDNWIDDTVDRRLKGRFSRHQAATLIEIVTGFVSRYQISKLHSRHWFFLFSSSFLGISKTFQRWMSTAVDFSFEWKGCIWFQIGYSPGSEHNHLEQLVRQKMEEVELAVAKGRFAVCRRRNTLKLPMAFILS